jgi:hypothetical protein
MESFKRYFYEVANTEIEICVDDKDKYPVRHNTYWNIYCSRKENS